MSDIPPAGFNDSSETSSGSQKEPPPDPEADRRAIGRQLYAKILGLQEHQVFKGFESLIAKEGVKKIREIEPVSAWEIELHRESGNPIFQIDQPSKTNNCQIMYKLAPDGTKPERLGLGINGRVNEKRTTFFLEVDSDGDMEGLMSRSEGDQYMLTEVPINIAAIPAFIREMVERNSTIYADRIIEYRKQRREEPQD